MYKFVLKKWLLLMTCSFISLQSIYSANHESLMLQIEVNDGIGKTLLANNTLHSANTGMKKNTSSSTTCQKDDDFCKGPRGPRGPQGLPGPQGPQGIPGISPPTSFAYISAYSREPGSVTSDGSISSIFPFDEVGEPATSNITYLSASKEFRVAVAGDYEFIFNVLRGNSPGTESTPQARVLVNGLPIGYPPLVELADVDATDSATILGIISLLAMDRISLQYVDSAAGGPFIYPYGQTKVVIEKVN